MQAYLLNVPAKLDVVFTPDEVAKQIVNHFKPSGSILEPAKGDGAFLRYMPSAEWCELSEGKDFFKWHKSVDWIVSNPPYSIFSQFLRHSFDVADNIVYLIPINKAFNSYSLMNDIYKWGGIKEIYVVGTGSQLRFPVGYAVGAVHFRRAYCGPASITFREQSNTRAKPSCHSARI